MFPEFPRPVESEFKIDFPVLPPAGAYGPVGLFVVGDYQDVSRVGFVPAGMPDRIGLAICLSAVIVIVIGDTAMDRKPFEQDSGQVVIQSEGGIDIVAQVLMVTPRKQRDPRVLDAQGIFHKHYLSVNHSRSVQGIGVGHDFPDRIISVGRALDVRNLHGHLHGCGKVARDLEIKVGAEIIARAAGIYIMILIQFGVLVHTVLVIITQGNEIFDRFRSARNIDVVMGPDGDLFQELLHPVHIGMQDGIVSIAIQLNVYVAELGRVDGSVRVRVIAQRLVVQGGIVGAVEIAWQGRGALQGDIPGIADLRCPDFSFAGCDQNDAVGSADSVNRRSRRVLQNIERLDFVRIQAVERTPLNAIYHNQRRGILRKRADTSDQDIRSILTRSAAALCGNKTGQTADKHVTDVGLRGLNQLFGPDRGDGGRDTLLFLFSIPHYHNLIQKFRVLLHNDCQISPSVNRDLLGLESDIGYLEYRIVAHCQLEVTVTVCDGSAVLSLNRYEGSYQGDVFRIIYRSGYDILTVGRGRLPGSCVIRLCGILNQVDQFSVKGILYRQGGKHRVQDFQNGLVLTNDRNSGLGVQHHVTIDKGVMRLRLHLFYESLKTAILDVQGKFFFLRKQRPRNEGEQNHQEDSAW